MRIKLIAVGTRIPKWVSQGVSEYTQRMPKICQLEVIEVAALKRGKNADTLRILRDEAEKIRSLVDAGDRIIALDRKGKAIDTLMLAQQQQSWIDESQNIALVIGGPEGLDADFLSSCQEVWSLSKLTFAHPLVRLMVAEQVYRAWSINAGLPYHRGSEE